MEGDTWGVNFCWQRGNIKEGDLTEVGARRATEKREGLTRRDTEDAEKYRRWLADGGGGG
jgi:hypothetical protein